MPEMDKEKCLQDIFNNDPFGLLDIKTQKSEARTPNERLVESFQEINEFFQLNNREPESGGDVHEHRLYSRLKGFRNSTEKKALLAEYDKYGLLKLATRKIETIDDILNNDPMGLLNTDAVDIFTIRHIPKETTMPDYVAKRIKCKDFDEFEPMFLACQSDLAKEKRKLYPFKNEQQISKGSFFVLKGVLLYVSDVGKRELDANGKQNARLRCIFENGTESDMLLRSLAAELYKDGRRVTEHDDKLLDAFKNISDDDKETGFIYVLKSKNGNPQIASIANLYKIGYAEIPVEDRIKNAENEPTYLMAPVSIVTTFRCFNMNPQKLEQLLHNFFGNSCLNIDVFDNAGNRHIPREWFIVPLEVIEQAITFILTGEIVNYRYDSERQEIKSLNSRNS